MLPVIACFSDIRDWFYFLSRNKENQGDYVVAEISREKKIRKTS
jgi:hypothetical protein